MRPGGIRVTVAVALSLILWILAVTPGAGADAQAALEAPAPAAVQDLFDHTATWLARVGYPIQRRPVRYALPGHEDPASASAYAYDDRVVVMPLTQAGLTARARAWSRDHRFPLEPSLVIHELLHQLSRDEGRVDAVMLDLMPLWRAYFVRGKPRVPFASCETRLWCGDHVNRVLRWSLKACGCRQVRSPAARSARRWALLNDAEV